MQLDPARRCHRRKRFRPDLFGLSSSDTDEWWQERENEEGNGNRWSFGRVQAAEGWWSAGGPEDATTELETADAGEVCHTSSSVLMLAGLQQLRGNQGKPNQRGQEGTDE